MPATPAPIADVPHVQLDGSGIAAQMTPVAMILIGVLAAMLVAGIFVATLKVVHLRRVLREQRAFERRAATATEPDELRALDDSDGIPGGRLLRALTTRMDRGRVGTDELHGIAQQAITGEERRASQLNAVLQGVAATGPLLGLLGTVWGIIEAFLAMDQHDSSAIGVVAPAMAGALLTTALGLLAAIPSLLALQYVERRIGELVAELEGAAQTWIGVLLGR